MRPGGYSGGALPRTNGEEIRGGGSPLRCLPHSSAATISGKRPVIENPQRVAVLAGAGERVRNALRGRTVRISGQNLQHAVAIVGMLLQTGQDPVLSSDAEAVELFAISLAETRTNFLPGRNLHQLALYPRGPSLRLSDSFRVFRPLDTCQRLLRLPSLPTQFRRAGRVVSARAWPVDIPRTRHRRGLDAAAIHIASAHRHRVVGTLPEQARQAV